MPRIVALFLALMGLAGGVLLTVWAAEISAVPPQFHVGLMVINWEPSEAATITPQLLPIRILIGTGMLVAGSLAVSMVVRHTGSPAARFLRDSLALGSAATGWALAVHPLVASSGWLAGWAVPVSATVSSCGMMISLWLFGRFVGSYPRSVVAADLPGTATIDWSLKSDLDRLKGFVGRDTSLFFQTGEAYEAYARKRPTISPRIHHILQSTRLPIVACSVTVIALLPWEIVHLMTFLVLWAALPAVYLTACVGYWELNYARGDGEQQRNIRWMLASIYLSATVYCVLAFGYLAIAIVSSTPFDVSMKRLVAPLVMWMLPIAWFLLLLSIAASIFLRGAIEPALVLRRAVVYGAVVVFLTTVFVAVEQVMESQLIAALGLPDQTGIIVTGTLVALVVGGLKERLETRISNLIDRLMPESG